MKRIVKISQSKLAELLMRETDKGFLGDHPAFKGGSYRAAVPNENITPTKNYTISFTEEEINLVEDILEGVHPDNKNEEELLFKIKHRLRDSLLNK